MRVAIIGGTGFETIPGATLIREIVETPYGKALVYRGVEDWEDLVFLSRHGVEHTIPPHRINYRANLRALQQLGVQRVLATLAVGSIARHIPPGGLVAVDQFLDFTQGRESTFFNGGREGLAHTIMTNPYCPALRQRLVEVGREMGLQIVPQGTYVCTNGPRLETAAEIRMFALLGGDVVGMTGVPEAPLARELGLHYAALAYSINWAAGLEPEGGEMTFVEQGLDDIKARILQAFVRTLRSETLPACHCEQARLTLHMPQESDEA